LSPLRIVENITRVGRSLQKEIQGVILNDQALLANGNTTKKTKSIDAELPQSLLNLYAQDDGGQKVFKIEKEK
jgi:hypothetical protein